MRSSIGRCGSCQQGGVIRDEAAGRCLRIVSASRRSVLIGIAFRAPFTRCVSIRTISSPASDRPRCCIRILDRGGLETTARGSYGVTEAEYARVMGVSIEAAERAMGAAE